MSHRFESVIDLLSVRLMGVLRTAVLLEDWASPVSGTEFLNAFSGRRFGREPINSHPPHLTSHETNGVVADSNLKLDSHPSHPPPRID